MNDRQPIALERDGATADAVVEGGRVYRSNRRDFLDRDVAIVGDRIAALLEDAEAVVGPDTNVISAVDRVVLPGFVDAHTHADVHLTPERAAPALLASGTTSIVTESSGLGILFGSRGVETVLDRTAELPLSVFLTPSPAGFVDTFEPATADDDELDALAALFERDRVVGVGEIDWIHVVGRDAPVDRLYERVRDADATIVGHGAGCRGANLRAFATVVDNDHEAISAAGVRERADNGLHVVGRCGSIRDDLDAVVEAFPDVDRASVSLSTDGVWPPDLVDGFGMAEVVRRAIDAGIAAADAIDAATRNPAEHFGLGDRGVVAPGAVADLAIVDGLDSMAVDAVLAGGEVVVSDGEPAVDSRTDPYPDYVYDTIELDLARERFTAPPETAVDGTVRAMEVGGGLVTTETAVEPAVEATDGGGDRLVPDPANDALAATLFDRDPATEDRGFTGFLAGFGLDRGAISATSTWEVPGLVTVAADPDDALAAAERVVDLGGGFAIVADGEVVADLAMPVGAMAADSPPDAVAAGFEALESACENLGVVDDRPLLTVQTLTFLGVPALKLTPSGYADVLGRSLIGLDPDDPGRVNDAP